MTPIDIDFDTASAAWMANKIRKGPMLYYACTEIQQNGKPCPHAAVQEPGIEIHRCKRHRGLNTKNIHSNTC